MTGYLRAERKYCSLGCFRTGPRILLKKGEYRKCIICSREIYVIKARLDSNNFCSKPCHDVYQSKKISIKCIICDKDFLLSPSTVKRGVRYCGISCRNKCEKWKRNSVIQANIVQCRKIGLNKLELLGQSIIKSLNLPYEEQFLLEDRFLVDIFIPSLKVVIQWDGDYWHGYRKIGDLNPLTDRQRKRSNLDKSQDKYLSNREYKILRFWEHDVKNDRENVLKSIKDFIKV